MCAQHIGVVSPGIDIARRGDVRAFLARNFGVDGFGDGKGDIAIVTHDQGVVAVLSQTDNGWTPTEIDRKKKTFIIRNMVFEPGFKNYDGILPTLVDKLWSFATFNGCERITVEQVFPEKIGSRLNQELDAAAN